MLCYPKGRGGTRELAENGAHRVRLEGGAVISDSERDQAHRVMEVLERVVAGITAVGGR